MLTMILNLNRDVFTYIMSYVAKSGIQNLANAVLVCKKFKEIAEDESVLNAAVFNGSRLEERCELFQEVNSLIIKSAMAGNTAAKYVLAKIILISSTQLTGEFGRGFTILNVAEEDESISPHVLRASSFVGEFGKDRSPNLKVSRKNLNHTDLVRLFLVQSSAHDLHEMSLHVVHYFKYYIIYSEESDYAYFDSLNEQSDDDLDLMPHWSHSPRDSSQWPRKMQQPSFRISVQNHIPIPVTCEMTLDQLKIAAMEYSVAEFEYTRARMIAILDKSLVESM